MPLTLLRPPTLDAADKEKEACKASAQTALDALRQRARSVELLADHGQAEDAMHLSRLVLDALPDCLRRMFGLGAGDDPLASPAVTDLLPDLPPRLAALRQSLEQAPADQEEDARRAEALAADLDVLLADLDEAWSVRRRLFLQTALDARRRRLLRLAAGVAALLLSGAVAWYYLVIIPNSSVIGKTDLMAEAHSPRVQLHGIDGIEKSADATWRWGMGPEATLQFELSREQDLALDLLFVNKVDKQDIELRVNGTPVANYANLPREHMLMETLRLRGRKGPNRVEFAFARWNKPPDGFAPGDTRPLAGLFVRLALREDRSPPGPARDFLSLDHPPALTKQLAPVVRFADGRSWRWALGPVTELPLTARKGQELVLMHALESPLPNQRLRIAVDGMELAVFENMQPGDLRRGQIPFVAPSDNPVLRLEYAVWNRKGEGFAPQDERPMAMRLDQLAVAPPAPKQ